MNRLNNNHMQSGILVLALLLLTVFLASCGDDDPVAPVVTNHAPAVPAIDTASGAPADGATDVALTPQLHWTCSDSDNDPLTYTVSFGTSAQPPVVAQDQTAVSYTPSGLANGITYYWMVAASDDNEKTTNSPTWSFTTLAAAGETVTSPSKPSGPTSGASGETLTYTTTGGSSSEGHPLEYRFDWDDGTYSDWGAGGTDSHAWALGAIYNVRAQARCQEHTDVESLWSLVLAVSIDVAETVSRPGTPSGETTIETGVTESYSTKSASSSQGHVLEYRFDWGDGAMSDWAASLGASHTWVSAGAYEIKAQARCQEHTDVESLWSLTPLTVTVLDSETVSTPDTPSGPATGEIQETLRYDLSGAESTWGHAVEYQIDWGDGQMSPWSVTTFGVHSWSTSGTYEIKTQARCQEHPAVESVWSAATTVIISAPAEVIALPLLVGSNPSTGGINDLLEFKVMGGTSNLGHPTEIQIDWGDGTFSDWGPVVGLYYARSHAWTVAGTYQIKAHARCIEHPEYGSDWTDPKPVEITAVETISTPITSPSGEVTLNLGGWLSPKVLSGAVSNMGHAVAYQWDWGNGTMSTWSPSSNSVMPTDVAGDFPVRVHARCIEHPDVESDWSEILLVHIVDVETITRPNLSGPSSGTVGELLTFTVSGAESNFGHALEYQLWWGPNYGYTTIPLGWTTPDNLTFTFDQPYSGGATIQVQARCIEHPDVESVKSLYHIVIVSP